MPHIVSSISAPRLDAPQQPHAADDGRHDAQQQDGVVQGEPDIKPDMERASSDRDDRPLTADRIAGFG